MKKSKIIATILCFVLVLAFLSINTGCAKQFDGTIYFDGDGGTLVSGEEKQVIEEGGKAKAPVYERDGYTLVGFDHSLEGFTATVTIKAKWLPTSKGLEYELNEDGNSYKLKGMGTCNDVEVVPASRYNGKPVTSLGGMCVGENVVKFIVPYGVTDCGIAAGHGSVAKNIKTVVISETVEATGIAMFARASTLTTAYLPKSLKTISDATFGLTSITDIYYAGSEEDWKKIEIAGDDNASAMENVTVHYNSVY